MSVTFEVYCIGKGGQRELVRTTQSAREARDLRDAGQGEMLVIGRDDSGLQGHQRLEQPNKVHAVNDDIEGDFPI